jgi:hypothetical protein
VTVAGGAIVGTVETYMEGLIEVVDVLVVMTVSMVVAVVSDDTVKTEVASWLVIWVMEITTVAFVVGGSKELELQDSVSVVLCKWKIRSYREEVVYSAVVAVSVDVTFVLRVTVLVESIASAEEVSVVLVQVLVETSVTVTVPVVPIAAALLTVLT